MATSIEELLQVAEGPRVPRQNPRASVVRKLAKALKVKVAELLE